MTHVTPRKLRTICGRTSRSTKHWDASCYNVMNIMKTQNISHSEAEAIYFKRLENGETRAEIFLSHTSLDFVISEVVSLEHGSNELEVVP